MKPKHFVYLAFAAAISVLFATASFVTHNQWSPGRVVGAKLFPSLATDAGKVATIELRQGGNTLTLEKTGTGWGLKDRGGYPAQGEKVRTLFIKLAEAELIEIKTRRADRYSLIELEDPAAKDAKSRLVRLSDDKGGVIAEVVLGKKRWDAFGAGKGGIYVRKPADAQAWLANTEIEAPVAVKDWVKASVFETDAAKISRLTIEIPGEEPLKVERDTAKDAKDTKPRIVGLPEGKKLKDASAAEAIMRGAGSIDMEDMRKLESTPAGASLVKIEAEGGLLVTLRLRKDGDVQWLSIAATGEGEAKAKADEIAKRTQGWEFKIPAAKADTLLKRRADLLETS